MRILGGKDYYDSARAFGDDESLVFNRARHVFADPGEVKSFKLRTNIHTASATRVPMWRRQRDKEEFPLIRPMYIWFCGKLYRGVYAITDWRYPIQSYIWKPDELQQILDNHKLKLEPTKSWSLKDTEGDITKYFGVQDATVDQLDWLINNRIAIGISTYDCGISRNYYDYSNKTPWMNWQWNTDGLKAINFAKVVDPYQAFQELSMYVGGVLPRLANPTVEITDEKVMLAKHGMDNMSFKKYPQKG
jgi:hypothetical protein